MRKGAVLLLTMLAGGALAQTSIPYIPGTNVAYDKAQDPTTRRNTSTVYIDELAGTNNPTSVQFVCRGGVPLFFLTAQVPLVTQDEYNEGLTPDLLYQVDTQAPRTAKTLGATVNGDPDPASLSAQKDFDAVLLNAFKSARNQVVLRVQRTGQPEVRYTFPVKGFNQALNLVNNCK
ncbi:hypothetical protein Dcar01_02328 [Deinococcus carri]|uniref:Uncharacterized protein n=1 Tax=Deinococcus carri TaxID=1211323 RepID=A0ABP9W8B8_9DEIO